MFKYKILLRGSARNFQHSGTRNQERVGCGCGGRLGFSSVVVVGFVGGVLHQTKVGMCVSTREPTERSVCKFSFFKVGRHPEEVGEDVRV